MSINTKTHKRKRNGKTYIATNPNDKIEDNISYKRNFTQEQKNLMRKNFEEDSKKFFDNSYGKKIFLDLSPSEADRVKRIADLRKKYSLINKEYYKKHDASSLLSKYMREGKGGNVILYLKNTYTYGRWDIKNNKEFISKSFINSDGLRAVYVDRKEYTLEQLGNFLVGYNGAYAGFELFELKSLGFSVEFYKHRGNVFDALDNEKEDKIWYEKGYNLAMKYIKK